MRSRSFLFFSLAVVVSQTIAQSAPLVIAENGLISLNVPLTSARLGSAATRTTHPFYVRQYREFLAKLGMATTFELPYRFKTKGEMLLETSDPQALKAGAKLTMSCSHAEISRFERLSSKNHCGYCVPCIIRRASMKAANLEDAPYNRDVCTIPPNHKTLRGRDFRAFEMALERFRATSRRHDIFTVLSTGPLPPNDVQQYADVYRRGMEEVRRLLQGPK